MQSIISLSNAKFKHLLCIILTATLLLEFSFQFDVSGFICDEEIIWLQKAVEVALHASELLTTKKTHRKFPALFENTQLFGVEDKNFFVMPGRTFNRNRICTGNPGRDRVVIDADGNFFGVVYDTNEDASATVPSFKKCTPFLTFNDESAEPTIYDAYTITGFACGSNFVSAKALNGIKNYCLELKNLPKQTRHIKDVRDKKSKFRSKDGYFFESQTKRNYNDVHINEAFKYTAYFDPKCDFVRITPNIKNKLPTSPCLETLTMEPSPEDITSYSKFDHQPVNYVESDKPYTCFHLTIQIKSIRNYLLHISHVIHNRSPSNYEGYLIKQDDNLFLWPIFLPEKKKRDTNYIRLFAIGLDQNKKFAGIYQVYRKNFDNKRYKQCPGFDDLVARLREFT